MFSEILCKATSRVSFDSPADPVPTLLALLLFQPRTHHTLTHRAIHWRLDQVMTQFVNALIPEYHVESSQDLYSCVVTRLDHFVDTKGNFPREYIVAHVALPLPVPAELSSGKPLAPRTIGFLKFERCWRSYDPVDVHHPLEFPANRCKWLTADDTLGVYDPNYHPWASRRRTLLRSSHSALAVPLARALVAACALRRIHPDCVENTYAHAWFARGLWERLVDPDAADGSAGQDARSEDSGCSKWGLLKRRVLRNKTPAVFVKVLKEKEAEECWAVEDRVLRELEAGRAEMALRLSGKGACAGENRTTQMQAVSDLREALDRGVWAGARSDLDRRSASVTLFG
ncbi:uncharacterized protein BXZ73DRAFT_106993 [Epithele typhae]|uniref:uncharacterized protein n=1 Tax=Epithele typhae TaxID=378194 RepID=UPI00200746B9|nr:uncharacterized protein BXZ73DRAFT_106993 [Epithele typhae]KAH9913347.1 hypothetical protein BXZ73DRAFT_106993 [Epithele typhae]